MVRVGILGATGYTARELILILLRHPQVEITTLTTRQDDLPRVSSVHPEFTNRLDLPLENLSPAQVAERADCVFSCLPHGASAEAVVELLAAGVRVVDFSADFRLDDPAVFAHWYGIQHCDPERMKSTVYGLPELFRKKIRGASLVANPGCHPTTTILGVGPLLSAGLVSPHDLVISSMTGVSGGGRTPKPAFHFPECNESIGAYGVGAHRHTPEIDQILAQLAGEKVEVVFTPYLAPMDRGILATIHARPVAGVSEDDLIGEMRRAYADEPFVRVVDTPPGTKQVSRTNFCDVAVRLIRGRALVFSALDNLVKGASGAAVQNFNLMFDFDETTALL